MNIVSYFQRYQMNFKNQLLPFSEKEIQWHILYDMIKLNGDNVNVRLRNASETENACEEFTNLDVAEMLALSIKYIFI